MWHCLYYKIEQSKTTMQLKENQEFVDRIKKNAALSAKMTQTSQKFRQFEQLALYSQTDHTSKTMIVTVQQKDEPKWECEQQQRVQLQVIIGARQPSGPKCIEKILLNLINLVAKPSQTYSVVYINTLASSNAYADFRKIMQFLPVQYYKHLQKIYILHGNFKNKASYWLSFDYLTNYLKNKAVHTSTFKDLADRIGVDKEAFLKILPSQIVNELAKKEEMVRDILEKKKVKENIVFNPNIYNLQNESYIQKQPSALLTSSMLKTGQNKLKCIEQYEIGVTGAPLIIELLISYFNGKQELLNSEGIFRKSVSIEEETSLLKELSSQNYDCLETVNDPHLIANAIKRFLSNLAEPIIPYREFNNLMEVAEDQFNNKIIQIVSSLKNNRKMTLLLLIDFLKQKLLPRTEFNKMNENNLGIVLGPCLMHSQVPSMKDLVYTKKSINATLAIFQNFEKIFGNSQQRTILIRKSIHIQERQTLREKIGDSKQGIQQKKEQMSQKGSIPKLVEEQSKPAQASSVLNGIFEMMKQEIRLSEKMQGELRFQYEQAYQCQQTAPCKKAIQK